MTRNGTRMNAEIDIFIRIFPRSSASKIRTRMIPEAYS
jgi:hypothetical protein